jgi:hypothetical protein
MTIIKRAASSSAASYLIFFAALLPSLACSADPRAGDDEVDHTVLAVQNITLDARRSLAVTERPVLDRFSFQRVMDQLVADSGVAGLTASELFQQWWDTQNSAEFPGPAPHCNDVVDPVLGTTLNGYPYFCRPYPAEGYQASCDPFAQQSACAYVPIGLFNRFDLAPEDGSHCGEYRVVFAKESGIYATNERNLLIFEATLMNPIPSKGLKGCKKIVDVWADLSKEPDLEKRADALEEFYFDGVNSLPPVISAAHFGDNALGAGQVRSNQFVLTTTGWSLREYKLLRECSGGTCSALRFVPHSNRNNPFGGLFEPASELAQAPAFRAFFPSQVANLAGATLADITIDVPAEFDSGQSQASGTTAAEMRYLERLGPYPTDLRSGIQAALTSLSSTLTPDEIVLRAQAMSCAGCHRLNNDVPIGGTLTWPSALGFVHVSERDSESVDGVTRQRISDALVNEFLPHRKVVVEDFLNNKPRPSKGPKCPIGGRHSHG